MLVFCQGFWQNGPKCGRRMRAAEYDGRTPVFHAIVTITTHFPGEESLMDMQFAAIVGFFSLAPALLIIIAATLVKKAEKPGTAH